MRILFCLTLSAFAMLSLSCAAPDINSLKASIYKGNTRKIAQLPRAPKEELLAISHASKLRRNGDSQGAIKHLESLNRRNATGQIDLAISQIYLAQKQLPQAKAKIQAAISKSPNNPLAHQSLGKLYMRESPANQEGAIAAFLKSYELGWTKPDTLGYTAQAYIELNRYAEAEYLLKEALKISPKDTRVTRRLKQLYQMQGRDAEANAL